MEVDDIGSGDSIPPVMRAVHLLGRGGFEQLQVRDDVPVPRPGVGDVLIRVGAAGVNNTDINTRIGWYSPDLGWSGDVPMFPRVQGADAAGRIVAVGPTVDPGRIGDRVIVEPVFCDPDAAGGDVRYFGSEVDGAFAEYASVPSRHALRIDSALTDIELASFPCSYSAAENMVQRANVTSADRVLVTGASGGVGSAAVQLVRRRGAHVTAMTASDKRSALLGLGADEVVDRDEDLVETFGRGSFDVVIDVVGGPHWATLLEVLRVRGRYAVAGAVAGPVVSLDLRTLYLKDLRLLGCTVLDRGVFAGLVTAIERGEVQPIVGATFPLDQIVAAQALFSTKQHVGKIVLDCSAR
ncbi:MAG: NAD-dependent epimerase/dehydratase family protein [Ilumatobacteraceae bacterium]|nr:NAD-dependent epimerase/dehydratase family protein [Ilumatobacteraceae bacterium]